MVSKNWQQIVLGSRKVMRRSKASLPRANSDRGLTIIEGLVAIAVVAISVAVMSPMIILSVASRVQSQRAEQAFQVAQAEVDRIRLIVDRGNYTANTLNIAPTPIAVEGLRSTTDQLAVPAPINIDNVAYSTTSNSARSLDVNNDGDADFAVQIFKTAGSTTSTGKPVAFDLGVRVYRADVVGVPGRTLSVTQASLGMTSNEGQSATRPLANIYTSIIKSGTDRSLCDYHNFINTAEEKNDPRPSECD